MPLWPRRRPPVTPEPAPASTPEAQTEKLRDALSDAILTGNTSEARRLFDQAFWDKVPFNPDGYHLMRAVRQGDREMVKLLTTHGATWTPEETKLARVFAGPEAWQKTEGLLRHAGIRAGFTPEELKNIDPVAATAWARRTLGDAERLQAPDAARLKHELDNITATSVAALYCRGEAPKRWRCCARAGAPAATAARTGRSKSAGSSTRSSSCRGAAARFRWISWTACGKRGFI